MFAPEKGENYAEKPNISKVEKLGPSSHTFRDRFTTVFTRKIDWGSLRSTAKEWLKNPMNMVLSVWIICVAISGAILFLVMTGMLNHALPRKPQREAWFEVNNQILNALFTLMCLYNHPWRLHHLVLLLRWRPKDVSNLRKMYSKDGTYKPHERTHMSIVIFLLHLNCFAQYALCALNIGFRRPHRPVIGVAITISVAIASPVVAGVYTVVSPLGKDYDLGFDEESLEKKYSFSSRDEEKTTWRGGILDFWDDISLAHLSLFCSCCVFGWNMERLGFGNMYVHTATFLLLCLAPFWIFNLAALNINNEAAREALGTAGIFLCVFGLLYGGFWRIQMRKRFSLPPMGFCCGKPDISDCVSWLFCCWCSLAQEVRTANSYDIVEHVFRKKPDGGSGLMPPRSGPSSPPGGGGSSTTASPESSMVEEASSSRGKNPTLEPPVPSFIHREGS